MKKYFLNFLFLVLISIYVVHGQDSTAIPDTNFEQALIDLGIDSDNSVNGMILTEDIVAITDLTIFDKDIADLTGIEAFESLETLNCSNNKLSRIDISNNTEIKELDCSINALEELEVFNNVSLETLLCNGNLLTSLNIQENTVLKKLDFTDNQITGIDLTMNDSLTSLKCSGNRLQELQIDSNTLLEELFSDNNQLETLNVTENTFLRNLLCGANQLKSINLIENDSLGFLDISDNQLTTLDVTNNKFLTNLTCSKNQLTDLNLTENDSLTFLGCANNQLAALNLGDNKKLENLICTSNRLTVLDLAENPLLRFLDASANLITGLDISLNPAITSLDCSSNQLTTLTINNGTNDELALFNSGNNPNLNCIRVDDPTAADEATQTMKWKKDDIASYKEECTALTYVPDDAFELALAAYDDVPNDNFVPTANIETLTDLDIPNLGIAVLTGIEDFMALSSLNCSNNVLRNLDTTPLGNLTVLNCSNNDLVDLTLRNVPTDILTTMDATDNPLLVCITVNDVAAADNEPNWTTDMTASYSDDCTVGKTFIPDANFEQALIEMGYDSGSTDGFVYTVAIDTITSLDVSNRNILDLNGIKAFAVLESLDCSENELAVLDISDLPLKKLSCFSNRLSTLNVTTNDVLTELNCGDNQLSSLNVDQNQDLQRLVCDNNNLTTLDLIMNLDLIALNFSSNHITSFGLEIVNNTQLKILNGANNNLTTLELIGYDMLESLDVADNYIPSLDALSETTVLKRLNCSGNYLTELELVANEELLEVNCDLNQIESLNLETNTALLILSCNDNKLTELITENNPSLLGISVGANKLKELDLEMNSLLTNVNIDNNLFDTLNLAANDSLRVLSFANNNIDSLKTDNLRKLTSLTSSINKLRYLDLSLNDSLVELRSSNNSISSLDLNKNRLLRFIDIGKNNLTELLLGAQDSLRELSCPENSITSLDLGNNPLLTTLNCASNNLDRLNLRNGKNEDLITLTTTDNPNLFCIEIDDTGTIGQNWQKDQSASYSIDCHYGETFVPDDAFELALIALALDSSGVLDDYILTSDINTLITLTVPGEGITDLTGIQDFMGLETLDCSDNSLNTLVVDNNTALRVLKSRNNQLDSLFLGNNTAITELDIAGNQFSQIDLSELTDLKKLAIQSNRLTDLDISSNAMLTDLDCRSNALVALDLKNGNNSALVAMNATDNPNLVCIEVDDPELGNVADWQKDTTASYSENCHFNETFVPDDAFEQALIDMGYDFPGTVALDDYVPTSRIRNLRNLDIRNKGISDVTGLEDFENLQFLNCGGNNLVNLDITKNTLLKDLNCSGNLLTGLVISINTDLTRLNVSNNRFTTLEIGANPNLTELNCSFNSLTALDLTQNPSLQSVFCQSNQLISLDANNGNNGNLSNFDLRNNPNLQCVLVDDIDASLGYANWFKDTQAQYRLVCDDDDNDGIPDTDDLCPNTPFGDFVDLFGCSFLLLPPDNFRLLTTSETCMDANNGKVNISAVEIYNYTATITGVEINRSYNFTNTVDIRNLRAGDYELCITIEEAPDYINCYEIVITEPEALFVSSKVSYVDKKISMEMLGAPKYIIELNGSILSTGDASLTLPLTKGINTLKIKTEAACQGIYEETIYVSDAPFFYPNPVNDNLNILIGNDMQAEVRIKMYSLSGQLIFTKMYKVQGSAIEIDTSPLESGMYIISMDSGQTQSTFKITKK